VTSIIYVYFTPPDQEKSRQRQIWWLETAIRNLRAIRDEQHDLDAWGRRLLARHERDLARLLAGGAA
jgi:hypothetical protein